MDPSSIVAIIAATSALIVAVMTRCQTSRCTEVDCCWDLIHVKRDVKQDVNASDAAAAP
jgi:hypothetical protein